MQVVHELDERGYAKMHDFCMTIPFGGATAVAGSVSLLFGSGRVGGLIALSGVALCACAFLSLRAWKGGSSSVKYTAASGGMLPLVPGDVLELAPFLFLFYDPF